MVVSLGILLFVYVVGVFVVWSLKGDIFFRSVFLKLFFSRVWVWDEVFRINWENVYKLG